MRRSGLVQTAKSTVYTLAGLLAGRPYRLAFGGVLLAWLFFAGKKGRLAFLGTMAVFGAEVFYLLYQGRFVRHVEFSMTLAAVVFGVMCMMVRAGAAPGRRALALPRRQCAWYACRISCSCARICSSTA